MIFSLLSRVTCLLFCHSLASRLGYERVDAEASVSPDEVRAKYLSSRNNAGVFGARGGAQTEHADDLTCNTACGAESFEGSLFNGVNEPKKLESHQCAHCVWQTAGLTKCGPVRPRKLVKSGFSKLCCVILNLTQKCAPQHGVGGRGGRGLSGKGGKGWGAGPSYDGRQRHDRGRHGYDDYGYDDFDDRHGYGHGKHRSSRGKHSKRGDRYAPGYGDSRVGGGYLDSRVGGGRAGGGYLDSRGGGGGYLDSRDRRGYGPGPDDRRGHGPGDYGPGGGAQRLPPPRRGGGGLPRPAHARGPTGPPRGPAGPPRGPAGPPRDPDDHGPYRPERTRSAPAMMTAAGGRRPGGPPSYSDTRLPRAGAGRGRALLPSRARSLDHAAVVPENEEEEEVEEDPEDLLLEDEPEDEPEDEEPELRKQEPKQGKKGEKNKEPKQGA